jgi:hypothetical protein
VFLCACVPAGARSIWRLGGGGTTRWRHRREWRSGAGCCRSERGGCLSTRPVKAQLDLAVPRLFQECGLALAQKGHKIATKWKLRRSCDV